MSNSYLFDSMWVCRYGMGIRGDRVTDIEFDDGEGEGEDVEADGEHE